MLKPVAKVIGRKLAKRELATQKRLRIKITLDDTVNGFINGLMISDMTKTWQKFGLDCRGLNYFTLGAIENGLSTRFQRDSPFYGAWLGCYLLEHDDPNWSEEKYMSLSTADQKKWLGYFGDKTPKMIFNKPQKVEVVQNGRFRGDLYYWQGDTHSDVGVSSNSAYTKAVMDGMAAIMNDLNPSLNLVGKNFTPELKNDVISYEPVTLHGYHATFKIKPNLSAVMYVTSAEGKISKGKLKDYFSKLEIVEF